MRVSGLIFLVIFGGCLYFLLRARQRDKATERAFLLLRQAREEKDADAALTSCCAQCEQVLAEQPRNVFALHVWGAALWSQAKRASDGEADRLFAAADEKYTAALAVKPNDSKLTIDHFWALWSRADLHPGVRGLDFLEQICEECERLLIIKPQEAPLLNFWGSALCCMGSRTSGPEADRLYRAAEEKFTAALEITPNDQDVMSSLSNVLWRRARQHTGDEACELLARSGEWLDKALLVKPSDARALAARAWVLFLRARLLPGEETGRLLRQAAEQFESAQSGEDAETRLQAWGVVLWAQSRYAQGEESTRLLKEAKKKLAEAEACAPTSAAYNLACVCAQLGEASECRQWLEKSREPGVLVSRDQMASEEELASVRQYDWFRRMLG